ncbi:MAG: M48 family metallopeptidase [Burkholderiales bacterium]|nr:M48 family metallopeptidase [Burkholderiales bacterium]
MSSSAVTFVFAFALLAMLVTRMWLTSRQIRHVAQHRDQVPPAFAGTVTLEAHQRAADYTLARQRLDLLSTAWGGAILLGWTLLGGLDTLNQLVRSLAGDRLGELGVQVALLLALSLIGSLLDIPFDAWRTFKVEQQFGFNRMTVGLWLRDQLMGGFVGLVIGLPLLTLMLWLMASAGELWWLWAFGATASFMLLLQLVYPSWIAPLFNKFEPLADLPLKARVEALMQRCGFKAQGFYVMDGSKRSAHANAYFTGFGNTKRVVFFDTLLSKLSTNEVEAVLAHELGHFHHKHVLKRIASVLAMWLGALALLGWLMTQPAFYTGLGVVPNMDAANHGLALALISLASPVFTFFASPLMAGVSRRHEFEADAFAKGLSGAAPLSSALLKLYEDNASTLTPDPLYVRFHYSHPPASERLAALMAPAGQAG